MNKKAKILLILILLLATGLRFYNITGHDVINDEVFYGYRSISLIDTLNSPQQTTPFEWFTEVPGWAKLSFHDHPPLIFWIQHLFFSIFGNNNFALRLPFVLAGIASVYLIFLISRKIFSSDLIALSSAALLAVSTYHTWISRLALQESIVIFLFLLSIFLFLKALEDARFFYWSITSMGFAILAKYTAVILVPLYIFLFWKKREYLSVKKITISLSILLLILSPVIIYNLALYSSRGHFDFQISYLLGQDVPEWQIRPGREVGGFLNRIQNIFLNYWRFSGLLFTTISAISLFCAFLRRKDFAVRLLFGLLVLFFGLLLLIGPQERFLAMSIPIFIILFGFTLQPLFDRKKMLGISLLVTILIVEVLFAVNTLIIPSPKGNESIHYSKLRSDHNYWGYNELENYLQKQMSGIYAPDGFPFKFNYATKLREEAVRKAAEKNYEKQNILIVTDSTMNGSAALWHINRHILYDGWLVLNDFQYLSAVQEDPNFFLNQNFQKVIYIKAKETLRREDTSPIPGMELEEVFQNEQIKPKILTNLKRQNAFYIYEKNLN